LRHFTGKASRRPSEDKTQIKIICHGLFDLETDEQVVGTSKKFFLNFFDEPTRQPPRAFPGQCRLGKFLRSGTAVTSTRAPSVQRTVKRP
jgi:hypothetical protein